LTSTKFGSRKSRIEQRSSPPPNKFRTSVIGLSDVSSGLGSRGGKAFGRHGTRRWADTIDRDPRQQHTQGTETTKLQRRQSVAPTMHTLGSIQRETNQIMDKEEKDLAESFFML
jgi:hypothetical protein